MKLLRANMDTGELAFVPLAPGLRPLGGRGLISGLLLDEMDPAADAEGPENRLILCNGLLAVPNLAALWLLHGQVEQLCREFEAKRDGMR